MEVSYFALDGGPDPPMEWQIFPGRGCMLNLENFGRVSFIATVGRRKGAEPLLLTY